MNIPEYNIAPINAFIDEYDKHLETRENDVCMTLGRFSIGRALDSDNPADCSPIDCGNCTIIRPCMNYLDYAQVKTKFTQGKYGIVWEITRQHSKHETPSVVLRGIIGDHDIVTEKPSAYLVKTRMMQVALLAERFSEIERDAFHI